MSISGIDGRITSISKGYNNMPQTKFTKSSQSALNRALSIANTTESDAKDKYKKVYEKGKSVQDIRRDEEPPVVGIEEIKEAEKEEQRGFIENETERD